MDTRHPAIEEVAGAAEACGDMTPETLEALKASIEKWERNAVAETPTDYLVGGKSCPLCVLANNLANNNNSDDECFGCPVAKVAAPQCKGTPYYKAFDAHFAWRWDPNPARKKAAHEAAREEVAFLRSLLPEGEQP